MKVVMFVIVCAFGTLCCLLSGANGHGRMVEPPMRSSAWRYGFNTTKNYNDNELNCGGFPNQMRHNGMCGPCGDPWQGPRDNEAGGKYAQGVITRQYSLGQIINVTVELTSNHKGYFEFRICPQNNIYQPVTQACFDQHLLPILGFGTRYPIDAPNTRVFIELKLSLPATLTCTQCVLQWKWRAAQNRGPDGRGGECFGCGPQEHFINCADVSIDATAAPLPLNRPSVSGGAVVTFDKVKGTSSKSITYEVMPSSVNSESYSYTQPTNVVDNTNYFTEQSSLFTDQIMTPFDMNLGFGGGGHGEHFNIFGSQSYYDNTPMNYGTELSHTPTYTSPPITPSLQNTHNAISSTRALTSAIMTYISSLGESAGESVYLDGCPDSYAQPKCKSSPIWNNMKTFDNWCSSMCPTGVCPAGVCTCTCPQPSPPSVPHHRPHVPRCRGIPGWSNPTIDQWCERNCNLESCSSDFCTCE